MNPCSGKAATIFSAIDATNIISFRVIRASSNGMFLRYLRCLHEKPRAAAPAVLTDTYPMEISTLRNMLRDERGQGLVEYALIVALVTVVCVVSLRLLGGRANNALNNAAGAFNVGSGGTPP